MSAARKLRDLLHRPESFLLPGAFDTLSGRLVEQAGFEAAYLSGSAVAMTLLGLPDVGLLTGTEQVEQARRVANAISIPLICDMDTGYGNALNVAHTVRQLEASGVAGVQIEDQVFPKRCGHFEGKLVISPEEMVMKVRAALDARRDPDFVVIARTDARAVLGLEAAIERARAYRAVGADVIFVEGPESVQDLELITQRLDGPLLVNVVEGGKTPQLPFEQYAAMGFKIVMYPTASVRVAALALDSIYRYLRCERTSEGFPGGMVSFQERNRINDLDKYLRMDETYRA